MRVRVTGLIKHPKTGMYGFRMAVPDRHRASLNLREIKESYGTRCEAEALRKHVPKLAQVLKLFAQLEGELDGKASEDAERVVSQGFEALARRNLAQHDDGVSTLADAETNVILGMLMVLSFRVRCTWGKYHAWRAEQELLGDVSDDDLVATAPVGILNVADQQAVVAKINTFEGRFVDFPSERPENSSKALIGNPRTQGMAYREIAIGLIARGDLAFAEMEVMLVAEAAGVEVTPGTKLYDSVARGVLAKLAHHRSAAWIMDSPDAAPRPSIHQAAPSTAPEVLLVELPRTLEDAFSAWCKDHRIDPEKPHKTADEWRTAKRRFVDLHGEVQLHAITREMVIDFRDRCFGLPSRPKRAVKALALVKQVEIAKKQQLKTLGPNTVEKQICAIRSLLQAAFDRGWVSSNVAANVPVEGAGYVGDERDYFTSEELALIFSSPLATDPDACSDTMFYLLVLAALQGGRPGEFCKLKPSEVLYDGEVPVIRIRRTRGRAQKTDGSLRDVPVHWYLCEAGLMELAEIRREQGAEWLFDDLVADKYGDRYKFTSRKINRALRALGITAEDKCFYSTRHTAKREARRQRMPEQNSDELHGHTTSKVGRKYGDGVPTEILKEDIDTLEFKGVDWDAVAACGRSRIDRLRSVFLSQAA